MFEHDAAARAGRSDVGRTDRRFVASERPAPPPEPQPLAPAELIPGSPIARLVDDLLRFVRKGFARVAEFTPARLNFSWITGDLAVGGAFRTADIPRLQRLGINAIVDCREEASDDAAALGKQGIAFLHLPTPDAHGLSQEALERGVGWVSQRLRQGEKVYVHCSHGVGRGPLLACCVLVASGHTPTEALGLLKSRRWQASPNEEQICSLLEYVGQHPSGPTRMPDA